MRCYRNTDQTDFMVTLMTISVNFEAQERHDRSITSMIKSPLGTLRRSILPRQPTSSLACRSDSTFLTSALRDPKVYESEADVATPLPESLASNCFPGLEINAWISSSSPLRIRQQSPKPS